ncbi:MAG: hypothetical protein AMS23_07195 [Bacteroides sp. SM1_62]|nr:MAG: hypothetical protein AMS23_07195 [Bacteroides sp. SM1_62]
MIPYYILLIQLMSVKYSPSLMGSFDSISQYYAKGKGFSGFKQMGISEIAGRKEGDSIITEGHCYLEYRYQLLFRFILII